MVWLTPAVISGPCVSGMSLLCEAPRRAAPHSGHTWRRRRGPGTPTQTRGSRRMAGRTPPYGRPGGTSSRWGGSCAWTEGWVRTRVCMRACGVVWCGVVWCGVAWRGVAWRGVVGGASLHARQGLGQPPRPRCAPCVASALVCNCATSAALVMSMPRVPCTWPGVAFAGRTLDWVASVVQLFQRAAGVVVVCWGPDSCASTMP
jgi:hypothetical protein